MDTKAETLLVDEPVRRLLAMTHRCAAASALVIESLSQEQREQVHAYHTQHAERLEGCTHG